MTVPCIWFDSCAEEAALFYVDLLPDSSITRVFRLRPGSERTVPGVDEERADNDEGRVLTVEFTLGGTPYMALNGGPTYKLSPAASIYVECADQPEIDRLWSVLSEGGETMPCGWLTDRFGLSWQIVPAGLTKLLAGDAATAQRVMDAALTMTKIDMAQLQAAAGGPGTNASVDSMAL